MNISCFFFFFQNTVEKIGQAARLNSPRSMPVAASASTAGMEPLKLEDKFTSHADGGDQVKHRFPARLRRACRHRAERPC